MTRALVTGATGFIGGHLVEELVRRGYAVRCLVRPTSQTDLLQALPVEILRGDLEDDSTLRRAVQQTDVVFHLAGVISAAKPQQLLQINGALPGRLAAACASCLTPPVLVYVSSVAAAGPSRRGTTRSVCDPPAPVSHYGRSKRTGELQAALWADQVPITVVRPGIVFGPRDRELKPAFWTVRRLGIHFVPTWDPPPLSWISVQDLVDILLRAYEQGDRLAPRQSPRETNGLGCYFACNPEYPTYAEFGRLAAQGLGRRHLLVLCLIEPLCWLGGAVTQWACTLAGRQTAFNIDKIREATAGSWACSARYTQESLRFQPTPLAPSLAATARWYVEQRLI